MAKRNTQPNYIIVEENENPTSPAVPANQLVPEGYTTLNNQIFLNEDVDSLNKNRPFVEIEKEEILEKTISKFIIDTSELDPNGGVRDFSIEGDDGAIFSLEVYDDDGNYYNFLTKTWSSSVYRIKNNVIVGGSYKNNIIFTNVASKTHVYNIMLFAENLENVKTRHADYVEARTSDNAIDLNASTGSNSLLLKRTITQPQAVTLTVSAIAPSKGDSITDTKDGAISSGTALVMDTSYLTKKIYIGDKVSGTNIASGTTISAVNVGSVADTYTLSTAVSGSVSDGATITFTSPFDSMTPRYGTTTGAQVLTTSTSDTKSKFNFSITLTAASGRAFSIIRQPKEIDILAVNTMTIGADPLAIDGENIYSTAVPAFTGDDVNGAVTSGSVVRIDGSTGDNLVVGDKITTPTTTGTVDGEIADGTVVTLLERCDTIMAVGDQVTGSGADGTGTILEVTVVGTGRNINRFTVNEATSFVDNATLTFSSKVNRSLTTVTVVATSGTDTDFTMSQAIQFRDNAPLSFFRQKNYRWPVSNIAGINKNMILDPSKTAVNTALNSFVTDYDDSTTITSSVYDSDLGFVDTEITQTNVFVDAITPTGSATVDRLGITTAQAGNLVFNNQQALALKDDTNIKILGYGLANIKSLTYGADLEFSDLKVELTEITTATSSAVSSSTSIPLDERAGIMDGQSIMTGIGVSGENIKVVSGASGNTGAGTIVVSAAQTIEDNQTLTFANASNVATITGSVTIKSIPTSNSVVYFDVEKFLTCF